MSKKGKGDKPLLDLGQIQKIPSVTKAARLYLSARAEYAEAGKKANESKQRFAALLVANNLPGYVCDGKELIRTPGKETIKVIEVGVATDDIDVDEGEGEDGDGQTDD